MVSVTGNGDEHHEIGECVDGQLKRISEYTILYYVTVSCVTFMR